MILGVKTNVQWVASLAEAPVIGGVFLFVFIFVPAALSSFLAQVIFPSLNNDEGFTSAMLVMLPGWNIITWLLRVRFSIFFIPAWLFLGVISILKVFKVV